MKDLGKTLQILRNFDIDDELLFGNICLLADSYKINQHSMISPGTTDGFAYLAARPGADFEKTSFVGLQALVMERLIGRVVTQAKIDFAADFLEKHFGDATCFNREGWEHILKCYGGVLPVTIRAVPEGTNVPVGKGNALMTIETEKNDPKIVFLKGYLETYLLHVWNSSTAATLCGEIKNICWEALKKAGSPIEGLDFMLHDFGYRAAASVHGAGATGLGQLVPFRGTDTIAGLIQGFKYYGCEMAGFSITATEHSIMTARGEEGEREIFLRLLLDNPTGPLAVVIDSYDTLRFILKYALEFKDIILARDGKLVFRPDSGNPVEMTCEVIHALGSVFGFTEEDRGDHGVYQVLNPKVGALWGDGIDMEGVHDILFEIVMYEKVCPTCLVFGMGGHLHTGISRGTQNIAFKNSAERVENVWIDVRKNPKTDPSKASMGGRLELVDRDGEVITVRREAVLPDDIELFRTVLKDGKLESVYLLEDVRENFDGTWG
ncbi:nicotinate phosphoribosyltransferase [Candidatus Pacearchaeota archaeon]|nr:nicotinate phosphoribosyltransferase [Candidatus Pacearchaeota archaeon]